MPAPLPRVRTPVWLHSCEHTARTGRLDVSDLGDVTTFFGNHTVSWWTDTLKLSATTSPTPAPAPPNTVKVEAADRVVGRRNADGPPRFRPFTYSGFQQNTDGLQSKVTVFSRVENMAVSFNKIERKWNSESAAIFTYSHKQDAALMKTDVLNDTVQMTVSRYCRENDAWHGLRRAANEPVGMLNLRAMTQSDLFVGPPHHYGIRQPWSNDASRLLWSTIDGLYPQAGKHVSCMDVEPITGETVRYFWRVQWTYRVERDALFPLFVYGSTCGHRVPRCALPVGGSTIVYPEATYLPMFWRQDGYSIDPINAQDLRNGPLAEYTYAWDLSTQGMIAGGASFILGMLCFWCTLGRKVCGCCRGGSSKQKEL